MSLTIELSPMLLRQLADRAAKSGQSTEALACELLEKAIAPKKTLDEILAPFRQSFAESGTTEEELDALVKEAKKEIWEEDQRAKP